MLVERGFESHFTGCRGSPQLFEGSGDLRFGLDRVISLYFQPLYLIFQFCEFGFPLAEHLRVVLHFLL